MFGMWNWRWFAVIAVMIWALFGLTGCEAFRPTAYPSDVGHTLEAITTSMADQAVWNRIDANATAHVNNPGFVGFAGMLYVAGGFLKGVDGNLYLAGAGEGAGQMTAEAREVILKIMTDPSFGEKILEALTASPSPPATPELPPLESGEGKPE